jgi:hypothetical protein
VFLSCLSLAQTEKKDEHLSEHQKSYNSKAISLGIGKYSLKHFYKYGVNINKLDELKNEGIDLIELSHSKPARYAEISLYSTTIVQGTIISKTYHLGKNNYFHTTYKIQIDNVVKGCIDKKVIEIKTISGLVDDNTDTYVTMLHEPSYFLGEKSLFLLDKFDFQYYEEGRKYSPSLTNTIFNIDFEQFIVQAKYTLKSGYFLDYQKRKIGTQEEVLSQIKRIEDINNTSGFSEIKF